ncbi:hypothetical protein J2774_003240 [Rhizobium pusense]|nr:hypothetical protein [Agrobacterium pusense]
MNNQLLTQPFQVFLILAVVYYAICWSLTYLANSVERRIARRRAGVVARTQQAAMAQAKIITEQP